MRLAGFGFGRQRPDEEVAHIKTRDSDNPTLNFVIENNIFDRSSEAIFFLAHKNGEDAKLIDNTYIQYPSGKFGRFGTVPTTQYHFEIRGAEKIAKEHFHDEGGKFYIAY